LYLVKATAQKLTELQRDKHRHTLGNQQTDTLLAIAWVR